MNVSQTFGQAGVTRRAFVRTLGVLSSGALLTNWMIRRALAAAGDWYRRALLTRNFSGSAVVVYKMVPLSGCRYSKADLAHMENKIFPTPEAALARRTHAMQFFGLKPVSIPRAMTNGLGQQVLFLKRKDFDARGKRDRQHWTKLGVSVDNVFLIVRTA
jgi:hypothetical protein